MQYLAITLTIILFSFSGCNNKMNPRLSNQVINTSPATIDASVDTQDIKYQAKKNIMVSKDEFEEEFENEFETQKIDNNFDPLSRYNRSMTNFNDKTFTYALNPMAEAYAYVTPQPLRIGLSNFIKNLNFPVRFANNLLQGKIQNASDELGRFLANSTIGLAGVMDPATTHLHISAHEEDFGQTLGYYGLGPGFHIVLPFLGPSNLRDFAGLTADAYVSPFVNIRGLERYKIPQNLEQSLAILAVHMVNKTSLNLGQYESIKEDALDLYPFLKNVYEQKRVSDIDE